MNEQREYYEEREQALANELEDARQLAEDRQDLIDEARAERAQLLREIADYKAALQGPKRLDQLIFSLLILLSLGSLGFFVGGAIALWRAFR